ncbi:glycosyltransferase [Candidatus Pseudothioglobus singularis]|nr:glycosyltransferase [Candidatus Pseudothioglobus singularis]
MSGGGAERVVLNLSHAVIELGHHVHIIILENKISYEISHDSFDLHILTENKKLSSNKFWNKVLIARELKRMVNDLEEKHGEFDLIISNLEDSDKTSSMAKLHNLYHCYHISMQQFLAQKTNNKKYYKSLFRRLKEHSRHKYLYNNSNMIAVSEGVMSDILDFGVKPKSIVPIYNPFNTKEIRSEANKFDDKIPKEKYIVNVARFSAQKRHDILIQAYAKSNIDHKLVLMGTTDKPADEENLKKIKKLINDLGIHNQVIFTGFVTNPYPWVKNADLFVLSSDHEGLANVLVESLILNTMVVSTNCPFGPSEVLTGKLSDFLSPIGDVEALSTNIVKALNNPIEITEDLIEKFDAKTIAKQYLSLAK